MYTRPRNPDVATAIDQIPCVEVLGETLIELVLETHGVEHIDEVCARLADAGYRFERK